MSEKREAPGGVQTKEDSSQADDAYRQLFDLSPAGVMIVEKDGAVKLANPAVVRLLACPDESALSEHSLLDFIAPRSSRALPSLPAGMLHRDPL